MAVATLERVSLISEKCKKVVESVLQQKIQKKDLDKKEVARKALFEADPICKQKQEILSMPEAGSKD